MKLLLFLMLIKNTLCLFNFSLLLKREILQASYSCKLSYSTPLNLNIKKDYSYLNDYNNYYYLNNNITKAQLYILYNKNKINIAFKGSKNINDIFANLNINQRKFINNDIKVHSGYLHQYLSLKYNIINVINNIIEKNKINDIIFTGHSLGGSIATIASIDLFNLYNKYNIKCYTFGSPKVGNIDFCTYYNKHIKTSYRFVNKYDYIEHLPPLNIYHHPTIPICINNNPNIIIYNQHNINTYIHNIHKII